MYSVLAFILLQVATIISCGNVDEKKEGLELLKNGKSLQLPLTDIGPDNYGTIGVGSEISQQINVVFDTSANITWLLTKDLPNRISGSFKYFEVREETSFKKGSNTFTFAYDSCEVSGHTGTDTITINTTPETVVFDNFEFGLVTKYGDAEKEIQINFDGVFGLNLVSQELIEGHGDNFLYRLSKELDNVPCFGFQIDRLEKETNYLVFGEPEEGKVDETWISHDVQKVNGFYNGWNVRINSFFVIDSLSTTTIPVPDGKLAQLTSVSEALLVGPRKLINRLNDEIFGTVKEYVSVKYGYSFKSYHSDLSKIMDRLPQVQLVIDNDVLFFDAKDYITVDDKGNYQSTFVGVDNDDIILGWKLLSTYYTKFDYQDKKVHFSRFLTHGDTDN